MRTLSLLLIANCFSMPLLAQSSIRITTPAVSTLSSANTMLGVSVGNTTLTGDFNTFMGYQAGQDVTSGSRNVLAGYRAGAGITAGSNNTFLGFLAGSENLLGGNNTFVGSGAGTGNTSGSFNTFIGDGSGAVNTNGGYNTFLGKSAGVKNVGGNFNTFVGYNAGNQNTAGIYNTFVGYLAGTTNLTGNSNTVVGHMADVSSSSLVNATAVGYRAKVALSNALVLGDPNSSSLRVGIGTDSPQFLLDVRGTINIGDQGTLKFSHLKNPSLRNGSTNQFLSVNEQGETVLANYRLTIESPDQWADKVFSGNYHLRSLPEVEAFILNHKHLPGIPSAEEVARNGADPTQLISRLLEKVEELTLYMIQMKKENEELYRQLNARK